MDYVLIEMIHQILHRCWFNGIVMGSYRIMEQTIGLMCSNPQISEAWWFYCFFWLSVNGANRKWETNRLLDLCSVIPNKPGSITPISKPINKDMFNGLQWFILGIPDIRIWLSMSPAIKNPKSLRIESIWCFLRHSCCHR